jgi:hypothetical protein
LDLPTRDGTLRDKSGQATQINYLSNNQTLELYGRLHADLLNSDRMLINVVDMKIKLTRAPEAFYLWGHSEDTKLGIKLSDATLIVTQVEFKPLF